MPQTRGESWKARERECEETVQARTVGIAELGAGGVMADKPETYWPRSEGAPRLFFEEREFANKNELFILSS